MMGSVTIIIIIIYTYPIIELWITTIIPKKNHLFLGDPHDELEAPHFLAKFFVSGPKLRTRAHRLRRQPNWAPDQEPHRTPSPPIGGFEMDIEDGYYE